VTGFLLAPEGVVTINEGGRPPVRVPLREQRGYDRLASALGERLGATIEVVTEAGPALRDSFPQLVPAIVADDAPAPESTMLLDASPSDAVQVVRGSMLGALTAEGLDRWRAGEPAGERALLGRADVAERIDGVTAVPHPGGYAYLSSPEPTDLIVLVAAYLRAAEELRRQ
jgi:hypothetical protein